MKKEHFDSERCGYLKMVWLFYSAFLGLLVGAKKTTKIRQTANTRKMPANLSQSNTSKLQIVN